MSCNDKIPWTAPEGETIKLDKLAINKAHNAQLNVVIARIEHVNNEVHFVLSTGCENEIRIIGDQEWDRFLQFLGGLNWSQQNTDEYELFDEDENLPFAEEINDDDEPWVDTVETPIKRRRSGNTLELPVLE